MGSVTVSVRSILLAGLVALGLLTAYLLGAGGDVAVAPAGAAPQAGAEPDRRVIRMVGTGEASAVPDQVSFGLSVTAKRLELEDALDASSATMRRVLAELEQHGVEGADVQTTGLSMYPEYDYHSYGPPTLTGYRVTQRARVLVTELKHGGRAIAAAVQVGGNGVRVDGIRLEVGDPDAVLERARDAAVAAATAKAEQYAAAAGQSLSAVLSIREVGSPARYAPQQLSGYLNRAMATTDAALPIEAGRDDLKVRVQVVWAFE